MTIYAQVPELSAVYTFVGPDGTRAVLNNAADADYVGTFSEDGEITGLDDAEIRENAEDLVEADGAVHGPFWLGRRMITCGIDVLSDTAQQRGARLEKLKRATAALRADGTLSWTTPYGGGGNQQVTFRRNQPRRITGKWKKSVFLALACADPRIYSTAIYSNTQLATNGNQVLTNQGDYFSPPSIRINGPGTNPTVTLNNTLSLVFNGLVLTAGQYVIVNLVQRTVVDQSGANRFDAVDWPNTWWWQLAPGDNNVKITWVSGNNASSTLVTTWRDAWA